ncbi:acyl carrier protein [Bacillus songklensis]|uniref:Acyl carrier protein n=1 Tax=Bacillus songklensis TaxID=1069116 RepID=A0ABV8B8E9_9BACI
MILEKLQEIFRDILDNEELVITEHTTRDDFEGWDSLATVSIIVAVSEEFNINIGVDEVEKFKNVKSIVNLIKSKME